MNETIRWLESQCDERIVFPSEKAREALRQFRLLLLVLEASRDLLAEMEGDWIANSTDRAAELSKAIDSCDFLKD